MFCGPSSPKNISAGGLGHLAGPSQTRLFEGYEPSDGEAPEALVLHGC